MTHPEDVVSGEYVDDLGLPEEVDRALQKAGLRHDKNTEREWKIEWYYGGLDVLRAETARGPLIVASGPPEEVAQVVRQLTQAQRRKVVLTFPDYWGVIRLRVNGELGIAFPEE